VSFDVDRYSEHIRNSQVKHDHQVTKKLEHLIKFYKPENGGQHKDLWQWWIAMARLAVVSAGGAKYSKTGESQLPLMNFTMV